MTGFGRAARWKLCDEGFDEVLEPPIEGFGDDLEVVGDPRDERFSASLEMFGDGFEAVTEFGRVDETSAEPSADGTSEGPLDFSGSRP